jgi:molybdopterin converting factor small subunit
MPTEPQPTTLAEVVNRAVDVADPDNQDASVAAFQERFEDADEPVTAVLDGLEERLADAVEEIDVELDDPAIAVTVAVVQYLARRRDELDADADTIMRLAVRAEWRGDPPASVLAWLGDRGVDV